ncbi:MAG: DUF4386 family protein [Anaerolineales bacterium]|nr:DUF4386 family protein [Chloroflexota bacterium]MBL6983523.1 DUF4386 family protein [Anaerolineales bacterium]
MKNLQKLGGFAALYAAAAYLVGFVLWGVVLGYSSDLAPAQKVASFVENQGLWYFLNLTVYVVWGFIMVVLALALNERLKTSSPTLIQIATATGLIWAGLVIASGMIANIGIETVVGINNTDPAQAASIWAAVDAVRDGIGGGNEIVGGLWVLLVSWAALQSGTFSKALNYLGLAIGVAGILSAVPPIRDLASVFGLTQIIWFIWLGIAMLRKKSN